MNRPEVRVYEVKQPFEMAEAKALANPRWGDGGLDQVVRAAAEDKALNGMIEKVDTRPLHNLPARFEDPRWTEADPSLPHSPPLTVEREQRIGFAQGTAVGATTALAAEAPDGGGGFHGGGGGGFGGAGASDEWANEAGRG